MIDTAHSYTGGESERTIGAALAPYFGRGFVATKGGAGGPGRGRPENLRAEIEESFRRLRTDSIALYYLHRVDPETPIEESLAAIKEYRDRGKIRHIGISEVSIDQIERARAVVPIAAVQNHYNLSERKHDAVVDYCTKEGIVFVPFFPLRGDGGGAVREIARKTQRYFGADRAGMASQALADNVADPRNAVARASEGKHGRAADYADRR